jgi:tRNA (adenine22-N1)-methyltransferase
VEAAALSLSPRLRAVADAVPPGARVADVGTDHALLLAWLRDHGRVVTGIGIDLKPGPLAHARRTLAAAGVSGVELRQGDGLRPLCPGEVDVVVIAGMGGARIVRLLDEGAAVVSGLRALVLQPNTEWPAVRRWVTARGLQLAGEAMVEDRGKFYVVLDVRPGSSSPMSEDELELGPRLLLERPPAFVAWLRHELGRTEQAMVRVAARNGASEPRADEPPEPRLVALRRRVERLRRVLLSAAPAVTPRPSPSASPARTASRRRPRG